MSNNVLILYKEVGKKPVKKYIPNTFKSYTDLLGENLTALPFKDILIIYKKNSDKLRANIYIGEHMRFGTVIKGDVIVVAMENKCLKSLTDEQADIYKDFLIQEQFDYTHFDEEGRYISNKELKKRRKANNATSNINKKSREVQTLEKSLAMIYKMQVLIYEYLKEYSSNKKWSIYKSSA